MKKKYNCYWIISYNFNIKSRYFPEKRFCLDCKIGVNFTVGLLPNFLKRLELRLKECAASNHKIKHIFLNDRNNFFLNDRNNFFLNVVFSFCKILF